MAIPTFSKFFGEIVRVYRTRKKLTQEQLAEKAGVHPTYVGMVERGIRNCSLDIASSIANALDTSLTVIIKEAEIERARGSQSAIRKAKGS